MKKAYVKPVFFAEEFAAEASYAAGGVCGVSIYTPYTITRGMQVTDKFSIVDKGDAANKDTWYYNPNYTNWSYATAEDEKATLFMDVACDFTWNPNTGVNGAVYVWNDISEEKRTEKYTGDLDKWNFMKFFTGNKGSGEPIEFHGTEAPMS